MRKLVKNRRALKRAPRERVRFLRREREWDRQRVHFFGKETKGCANALPNLLTDLWILTLKSNE